MRKHDAPDSLSNAMETFRELVSRIVSPLPGKLSFPMALSIGSTPHFPGDAGDIVSGSLNSIFHLGGRPPSAIAADRRATALTGGPSEPYLLLTVPDSGVCIHIDDLRFQRDGVDILRGLSLTVRCGERLIIAGPNGAGKTTLLKVLLGLVRASSGRVSVLGHPVGSRPWARGRRRVGYVNQESVSVDFPVSGREVVEIGACALPLRRGEKRRRIDQSMAAVGCSHLSARMYARLSGGEKQKLSLARCLCQDPELLLLDEPTSFLDPVSRAELMGLLGELNERRGLTVVMVSHDPGVLSDTGWRLEHMEAGVFA